MNAIENEITRAIAEAIGNKTPFSGLLNGQWIEMYC